MFIIQVNCVVKKVRTKLCLLLKISGVKVTPSVTSVESSEQFWHTIRQIWRICEPWVPIGRHIGQLSTVTIGR